MGLISSKEDVSTAYTNYSSIFTILRLHGVWPTLYPEDKRPVTVDVLEAGLILAFVMVAFCMYIVLPGIRGKEVSAVCILLQPQI